MNREKQILMKLCAGWTELKTDNTVFPKENGMNIFKVLGIQTKEVLICRMLGELLNQNGSHGLDTVPVCTFLRDVCGVAVDELQLKKATVTLEEVIDENRRVDIVIRVGSIVVPIEAKVYAGDQNAQLEDYYNFYFGQNKDKTIFYLTPDGHTPSEQSGGKLDVGTQIKCLSFREDIAGWLRNIRSMELSADVDVILRQFEEVIEEMGIKEKKISEYIKLLNPEESEGGLSEEAVFALNMMNNAEDIIRHFKIEYLKKIISCDGCFVETAEVNDETDIDNHVMLRIKKGDTVIAWISANKNLYLSTHRVKAPYEKEWAGNDGFKWRYIHPDGNNRKMNMDCIDWGNLNTRTIDIKRLVEQIEIN